MSDNRESVAGDAMANKWQTVADACHTLGISQRTLYRRIKKGEIQSKLESGRRLILIDDSQVTDSVASVADMADAALLQQIKSENEHLRDQVKALQEERRAERESAEQSKERSDTIILQLTRQVDQAQRLLEHHQEPWYRRVFRKRREDEMGKP